MLTRLFRRATNLAEAAGGSPVLDPPAAAITETARRALVEARVRADGTIPIRIISPGHGSSGYYSAEVLEQAARDGVFPAGLHMFFDHPGATESVDRPERSLRDLVGVLASPGRWQADHPDGPGIYAEALVYGPYRDLIAEMAPDIGVSIRATAETSNGTVDGQTTRIIERILEARSVDYVTAAGRGGRILELLEAARAQAANETETDTEAEAEEARNVADWIEVEIPRAVIGLANAMWGEGGTLSRSEWEAVNDATADAMDAFRSRLAADAPQLLTRDPAADPAASTNPNPVTESEEDIDMTPEQIREAVAEAVRAETADLREAVTTLTAENESLRTDNARLSEAQLVRDARDHITAALDAVEGLPAPTVRRLVETLAAPKAIPVTDDGTLDTAALDTKIDEATKAELDYLADAAGTPVRGVGGTVAASNTDELAERRTKAFQALGLSEDGAKIAAEGRR